MRKSLVIGMVPFYLLAAILCIGVAVWGSESVTTAVQNSPVSRQQTIVIDAGHGGIDGGATSCTGVLESTINLQIALRLEDLLNLIGYDTVMIRKTDTSVHTEGSTIASQKVSDLKERVRICNETDNGILVSIHQNIFSDSRYGGAQVFYATAGESEKLANILQQKFCDTLNPGSTRKSKRASTIYLLQNIKRTGVLIECGFLSNPQEEEKLRNPSYQQKICCIIVSSIAEFLKTHS